MATLKITVIPPNQAWRRRSDHPVQSLLRSLGVRSWPIPFSEGCHGCIPHCDVGGEPGRALEVEHEGRWGMQAVQALQHARRLQGPYED
jgi:hypothetical protein